MAGDDESDFILQGIYMPASLAPTSFRGVTEQRSDGKFAVIVRAEPGAVMLHQN